MIIWISGAYGVGKSTLADALAERMENPLIFDAEEVGNAVRGNYPDCPYGYIFEDYPLWGEFCHKLLRDIHDTFQKDILVPMTLVRRASYEKIIQSLAGDGIETFLIILEASRQSIHDWPGERKRAAGAWRTLKWRGQALGFCPESTLTRMTGEWKNWLRLSWPRCWRIAENRPRPVQNGHWCAEADGDMDNRDRAEGARERRNWQASPWARCWRIAEKQFSVAQDKLAIGMPKVNGVRADRDK